MTPKGSVKDFGLNEPQDAELNKLWAHIDIPSDFASEEELITTLQDLKAKEEEAFRGLASAALRRSKLRSDLEEVETQLDEDAAYIASLRRVQGLLNMKYGRSHKSSVEVAGMRFSFGEHHPEDELTA